jgi:hypothetical protein
MSEIAPNENTELEELTIQGQVFLVPAPFEEGHVLRKNEADQLNQVYKENIRNNFASTVAEAIKKAKDEGVELNKAELQSELDAYVKRYDFGVRRGGVRISDPVLRRALDMAEELVVGRLKAKGVKLKDVPSEEKTRLINETLERFPQIKELAKQQLEQLKSLS